MAAVEGRAEIRHIATRSGSVVLVCRKCSKKLDGGFGPNGDQRLAKVLRRSLGRAKAIKAAATVLEVDCLDLCPKDGVVVVRGDRPGDWLVVPRGTPLADVGLQLGWTGSLFPPEV